jgi:hypothetical protein
MLEAADRDLPRDAPPNRDQTMTPVAGGARFS